MAKFSKLAETLIGSEIVRLGNEISARVKAGEKIYNYTIGDFDPSIFPIPDDLKQDIITAYEEDYTNYPPGDGLLELRKAVSEYIKEREGIAYKTDEILIASGGRPLIYALFKTIVDPGDKVIFTVPSWNNNHYTHMNSGEPCIIETTPEHFFMPTAEDIEHNIKDTVLICLCTPQNPTGTTLDAGVLKKICEAVVTENNSRPDDAKKVYIMFDQMYWQLTFGNIKHHNPIEVCPEVRPYCIFIDGISKSFAATGVRVGWALGPAGYISKMKSLLTHVGAWAPMAEQKATADFLGKKEAIDTYLSHYKGEIEHSLTTIYDGLIKMKESGLPVDAIAPQAAIYLTVKMDFAGKTANGKLLATQADVATYILDEAKLAIVPFSAFGSSKDAPWYRLSVGTCDKNKIEAMLAGLRRALEKLS
jgi:aspartate aminotransferase